jgi:hypothetical protein
MQRGKAGRSSTGLLSSSSRFLHSKRAEQKPTEEIMTSTIKGLLANMLALTASVLTCTGHTSAGTVALCAAFALAVTIPMK